MYKCFHCGGEVYWDSDLDYSDFEVDGDGIVQIYHCCDCGADIYYCIPIEDVN